MKGIFRLVSVFLCLAIRSASLAGSRQEILQRDSAGVHSIVDSIAASQRDSLERARSIILLCEKSYEDSLEKFSDWKIEQQDPPLTEARRDTVRRLLETMKLVLRESAAAEQGMIDSAYQDFVSDIRAVNEGEAHRMRDSLQKLAADFHDDLHSTIEQARSALLDSLAEQTDSLDAAIEELGINQLDEFLKRTTWLVGLGGGNDLVFRGRDGGKKESFVSPSVIYSHSSGWSVSASAVATTPGYSWDEAELGARYKRGLRQGIVGGISFTHFFFSDSSTQVKATLKNSIGLELSFGISIAQLAIEYDHAWGQTTDDGLAFQFSKEIVFVDRFPSKWVSLEPSLIATLGTQNLFQEFVRNRALRGRIVTVTRATSSNFFGIVNYEFLFPLTWESGSVAIEPAYHLNFPKNTQPEESSAPFSYITLNVTLTM